MALMVAIVHDMLKKSHASHLTRGECQLPSSDLPGPHQLVNVSPGWLRSILHWVSTVK